jgi:hypothetical protein
LAALEAQVIFCYGLVFGYGAIRPEDFDEPIRRLLWVIRGLLQTV